ncbi:hypothetical protein SAMN06296036_12592 [Pseudobacteriovorax antillogorgiicola]|uniref:Uncharacterized protein n=1 Tax=Pseudobacteriovorax antillogorgiicola TaxID=1513793 RepID=A0A1Y6CSG7_9BACT|nr:hypothetical protein EDD56_12592 [Pseudobacteriovorax antillogorgiicola]SMF70107.1 hypothetical protein SAMN06296036_12592 [Pseudobacteriovorax antillogorgiicola]
MIDITRGEAPSLKHRFLDLDIRGAENQGTMRKTSFLN